MNSFRSFVFVLIAVCTLTASTHSKAAIGIGAASPVTIIAGAVVASGGALAVGIAGKSDDLGTAFFLFLGGIGAFIAGVIVLDGEDGQSVIFSPLTPKEARELSLTKSEAIAFNSQIDQVNALAAFVDSEISQIKNPTTEDAAAVWTAVKGEISPEAFSALGKVSQNILR